MISFSKEECDKLINLSKTLLRVERDESPRPISYDFYENLDLKNHYYESL